MHSFVYSHGCLEVFQVIIVNKIKKNLKLANLFTFLVESAIFFSILHFEINGVMFYEISMNLLSTYISEITNMNLDTINK